MVKVIAGLMGTSVASGSQSIRGPELLKSMLDVLKTHNVRDIDTARVYNGGQSEEDLGGIPEAKMEFHIATKAPGFGPGTLAYDNVKANCNASLKALKQEKIELYYFHGPDRETPLEESCRAIHELHQEGKIAAFGLSNLDPEEVAEIHDICSKKGWVKPTVYQGGYNPLWRAAEPTLCPELKRLGMAYYIYSPLAGGFFAKSTEQLRNPHPEGRMAKMPVFQNMFVNDLSLRLHEDLTRVCQENGLTVKEATLRWLLHHSVLEDQDGIILGAASAEQMESNLQACSEGPLPSPVVASFENMWKEWTEAGKAPPAFQYGGKSAGKTD